MKMFLCLLLSVSNLFSMTEGYRDCTSHFTNRVLSFEYQYYPGYWVNPSGNRVNINSASVNSVKTDKKFQWILHECDSSSAYGCLEAKRDGYQDHYLTSDENRISLFQDTNRFDRNEIHNEVRIECTTCHPEEDGLTYSECRIRVPGLRNSPVQRKLYTNRDGNLFACDSCGSSDWFKWRILSPPTKQFLVRKVISNCNGQTDLPASYTVKSSITTGTSTTHTVGVDAKVNAGIQAGKLIKLVTGEPGISYSWSRTNMRQLAKEETVVLGAGSNAKIVKPGFKWVIKQLAGQSGYTVINTLEHRSEDIKC